MTVSKALRDAPDISAATKARVRALASELDYLPNRAAQGLRTRSTRLLGLVIPAITNPIFARMLLAMEEQTHAQGYDLVFHHTLNQSEREEAVLRRLISRRVDGLLIAPVYRLEPTAAIYAELARLKIPTVLLGHRATFCRDFLNVETDDVTGSYALTRHLLDLGHRRIAFFAGPVAVPAAQERLEGYRRALREAQLEWDDRLIFHAGGTIEEGEQAARQMLQESPGATAVQAVNDLVAIGAASVLLAHGLRIPKDLSVTGFGNILSSEHFRIPLTTVRQPKHALGLAAMDCLLALLAGRPAESRRLPGDLRLRESTGPAPSRQPQPLPT